MNNDIEKNTEMLELGKDQKLDPDKFLNLFQFHHFCSGPILSLQITWASNIKSESKGSPSFCKWQDPKVWFSFTFPSSAIHIEDMAEERKVKENWYLWIGPEYDFLMDPSFLGPCPGL